MCYINFKIFLILMILSINHEFIMYTHISGHKMFNFRIKYVFILFIFWVIEELIKCPRIHYEFIMNYIWVPSASLPSLFLYCICMPIYIFKASLIIYCDWTNRAISFYFFLYYMWKSVKSMLFFGFTVCPTLWGSMSKKLCS